MIGGMASRVSSPVFVGRRAELDQLDAAFDRASHGQPSLVLVAGEAGVGKSRLVSEFATRIEITGASTMVGGCLDLGDGGLPYAPFVEALRTLARQLDPETRAAVVGRSAGVLARLVPDLRPSSADASATDDSGGPTGRQAQLFDAVIGVLGRLSVDRPLAVVLEDIHWADESTRDLLRFLMRNLRDEHMLLIATYRSDDLHRRHPLMPLLSELERSDRVERLDLRPFDRDELADQLNGILGRRPTPALVDVLLARSDGLPFYVEELIAADTREGSSIPAGVRDILGLRLAALSEDSLALVQAAAVVGGRFPHERLAAVTGRTEEALLAALHGAIDARILVPIDGRDGPMYMFRHALLREAAYDDLLPAERVGLHTRLADHLEQLLMGGGATDVSLVADFAIHAYHAHDQVRALEGSIRAFLSLSESAAYAEALAHGERALELWSRVPRVEDHAGMDRAQLLLLASGIAANAGRLDRAVGLGREAVRALEGCEDRSRIVEALGDLARFAWEASDFTTGSSAAERANAMVEHNQASTLKVSILSMLGFIRFSEGRPQESAQLLGEAMTAATELGDRRAWASAAGTLAETMVLLGRPGRAARLADEAGTALIERSGEAEDFYGFAGRAFAIWSVGRFEDSLRIGREGLEWAIRYGVEERQGLYSRMVMIESLVDLGRYEEIDQLAGSSLARSTPTPADVWILQATARAAIARGRLDDARLYLDREDVVHGLIVNDVWRLEVEIELARAQGRLDAVREAVEAAIASAPAGEEDGSIWRCLALGVGAAADGAVAARARRRPDVAASAAANARRWLGLLRTMVDAADADGGAGPFYHAALATSKAEVSRADGAPSVELWADAARGWDALQHPLYKASARLRLAEAVLSGGGRRAEAESAIRSAHATALLIGANPLRAEVETLSRRARIDLDVPRAQEPDSSDLTVAPPGVALTARERDVLRLVAEGSTNREIGVRLFISEKTASVHVSNAMAKLGALSRYEAAAAAERLGVLS